jgi:hypothetical protein
LDPKLRVDLGLIANTRTNKGYFNTDAAVLSDTEDINEVVDAAALSRNNPGDGVKAKAEIIKANQYEQTLFDLVSQQHPRQSSPIWKFDYFKELHINRRGLRMQKQIVRDYLLNFSFCYFELTLIFLFVTRIGASTFPFLEKVAGYKNPSICMLCWNKWGEKGNGRFNIHQKL